MTRSPHISINLRMPPELHRQIVKLAAGRKPPRSLNSEIVGLLMTAVGMDWHDGSGGSGVTFTEEQLRQIVARVKAEMRKK